VNKIRMDDIQKYSKDHLRGESIRGASMMLAHYIISSIIGGKYASPNDDPWIHLQVSSRRGYRYS
jgi:hypothetical protein